LTEGILAFAESVFAEGLGPLVQASLNQKQRLQQHGLALAPMDPMTFAAVSGLLAAVAVLATYLPACRACGKTSEDWNRNHATIPPLLPAATLMSSDL
jgi:hypothetical protein